MSVEETTVTQHEYDLLRSEYDQLYEAFTRLQMKHADELALLKQAGVAMYHDDGTLMTAEEVRRSARGFHRNEHINGRAAAGLGGLFRRREKK